MTNTGNDRAAGVEKANIVGGCCGTTPEHISAIKALLKNTTH